MQKNLGDIINEAIHKAIKDRGEVNVLIAGKTGVGKSTLINAVFQGDFATTGQGKPVTKKTREIKKDGIPLTLFDTRGLELEKYKETFKESVESYFKPLTLEKLVGVVKKYCADNWINEFGNRYLNFDKIIKASL